MQRAERPGLVRSKKVRAFQEREQCVQSQQAGEELNTGSGDVRRCPWRESQGVGALRLRGMKIGSEP